jgi:hypothetical protein
MTEPPQTKRGPTRLGDLIPEPAQKTRATAEARGKETPLLQTITERTSARRIPLPTDRARRECRGI